MPYIDEATWQELKRVTIENGVRIEKLEHRIDALEASQKYLLGLLPEDKQPISPRDIRFWPLLLDEFAGSEDGKDFDEPYAFTAFVKYVNEKYPECMDLIFEIWDTK